MRTWNLSSADPLCPFISADSRSTSQELHPDYTWAFSLDGGDPPAIRMSTTFGLQVQRMHLYPAIGWEDALVMDPARFFSPPLVEALYPDFVQLGFDPLENLHAQASFWMVDSTTLLGRIRLENLDLQSHQVRLKLYVDFLPQEGSGGMRKETFKGGVVLAGDAEGLDPVLVVCGGAVAQESTHPALVVRDRLDPGGSRAWSFSLAVQGDFHRSVLHAREQCSVNWESGLAQLEQRNATMLDIETGDPDWDTAFWLTQREVYRQRMAPTRKYPHPGLLKRRSPDDPQEGQHGARSGGADSIPNAAEAYWMASQVLDTDPGIALDVVRTFLATQKPDGFTEGRPGIQDKQKGEMVIPLLANLTWRAYQRSEDDDILEDLYPRLRSMFFAWFDERNDIDQDGHPEWKSTFQAGFDTWPTFMRWQKWGQGLDIAYAETVDLAAYLYREAVSLRAMAIQLGKSEDVDMFHNHEERLHAAVEATWAGRAGMYRHVDRDEHCSPRGKRIGRGKGEYSIEVNGRYEKPVRLLVRVRCKQSQGKAVEIRIHGRGQRGRPRVEHLTARDFSWFWDYGIATTEKTYMVLSEVEIAGIPDRCSSEISIADYTREDQAGLLPLWAGIPDVDRGNALIDRAVLDEERFWLPAGIPMCSARDKSFDPGGERSCGGVSMLWSSMLGEGLVDYGRIEEAAVLLQRLMKTVVETLRVDKCFYAEYNANDGGGVSGPNQASGIAPLSLFLRVIGVRFYSPRSVWVRGHHPLPWPVTIRWMGLKLRLDPRGVHVTFPDGQSQSWEDPTPMLVRQVDEPHKQV